MDVGAPLESIDEDKEAEAEAGNSSDGGAVAAEDDAPEDDAADAADTAVE